jgi:hypothetical protein
MKLVKILIGTICLSLISLILSKNKLKKNKSHSKTKYRSKNKARSRRYDDTFSPLVIEEVMDLSIQMDKDADKMYKACKQQILTSTSTNPAKRQYYSVLETFLYNEKFDLNVQYVHEFLNEANPQVTVENNPSNKIFCGEYINGMLKADSEMRGSSYLTAVRDSLKKNLGIYTTKVGEQSSRFITSFASTNRDNIYRSKDMFAKLNQNK